MISAPAGPDVPEKIINLRRITNTGFMILIADSGSTKTEWLLVGKEGVERSFRTAGLNPYLLSEDEIRRLLTREVLVELPVESMTEIFFYGAGCVGRPAEMLCAQLRRVIGADTVEVHSDLLGAAPRLVWRRSRYRGDSRYRFQLGPLRRTDTHAQRPLAGIFARR